jgi:hypothetical protein
MTTADLPDANGRTLRDEARERIEQREMEAIQAEREAALNEMRPAILAELDRLKAEVRFDDEIRQAQCDLEDAIGRVEQYRQALIAARQDDQRARRNFKRARSAALREGLSEAELPTIPGEVSKCRAEGGWGRGWTGGA